jgi:CubicO group peptidase (beta-lactamase class C family)
MGTMVDPDKLRSQAVAELERWQVPALELTVIQDGETLLADGIGLRDVEQNLPAGPTTLFHHGSTGKAFTGVLAGTLVDAGLLEWDRPVREYLPDFRLHDAALGDRVTLTDLLSHRSGMVRHEPVWLANPSLDRAELVHRLRYLESPLDLRTTFSYSNLAYVTAGQVIAAVTDSTWEAQMRQRVLDPLGMERTVTSVDEARAREHAQPYGILPRGRSSRGGRRAIPWRRSDQIAPAGQMISCAVDMARWLRLQLGDGEVDGRRIISAETLAATKHISTPIDAPGPDPDIHFYGYGFGWLLGTYRGRRLVWHNGGIDGFKTDIALLPDDGIAVAVSCNVLDTNMPFAFAFHVLDMLLGEEQKPWSENLLAAQRQAPREPKPAVVPGTRPAHPLADYAGTYQHPGYGTVQVEVRGRGLSIRLGEVDLTSRYRHFETWTVSYPPLDESWPLTFITDAEGQVSAVEIPLEPLTKPIRFEAVAKETDR